MKKMMCVFLVLILVVSLCACGEETFRCGLCMKTVTERPHETTILGQDVKLCQECYEGLRALGELFD